MPHQSTQAPDQRQQAVEKGPIPFSSGRGEKMKLHGKTLDLLEKGILVFKMITDEKKKGDPDHEQRRH
ncbi:MAG: hypothetical protein EPO39_09370 [Candidatus Manganitrophaceae bacterium]|nr:MAG: hypothetical protein EPO39_09370 [Candidatus Manganitrophaceae bacterium]